MDLDEVAHYESPNQDLHCLQIQLYSYTNMQLSLQDTAWE